MRGEAFTFLFVSDEVEWFGCLFFPVFCVCCMYGIWFWDFYFDEGFVACAFDFWFEVEFDGAGRFGCWRFHVGFISGQKWLSMVNRAS